MLTKIRNEILNLVRKGKKHIPFKLQRTWSGQQKIKLCGHYYVKPASCVFDVDSQRAVTLTIVDLQELLKEGNLGERMPLGRNRKGDYFFPNSHRKFCNAPEILKNLTDSRYAEDAFVLRLTWLQQEMKRVQEDIADYKKLLAHLQTKYHKAETSEELLAAAGDIDVASINLHDAEQYKSILQMEYERLGGKEMLEEILGRSP